MLLPKTGKSLFVLISWGAQQQEALTLQRRASLTTRRRSRSRSRAWAWTQAAGSREPGRAAGQAQSREGGGQKWHRGQNSTRHQLP